MRRSSLAELRAGRVQPGGAGSSGRARAEAGACAVRGLLQAAQNPRDAPATLPIAFTPPYIYMFIRFSSCFTHCGAIDRFLKSSSQSNNSWGDQRAMV